MSGIKNGVLIEEDQPIKESTNHKKILFIIVLISIGAVAYKKYGRKVSIPTIFDGSGETIGVRYSSI